MSLAEEIQSVAENADKCVNYPIGEKIQAFIKQQDESNQTNFVLSGVIIYAASRIFGRKVDYLEQEIIGIAKNFAAIETSDEKQPEKEVKKTRTKKFIIKDGVNLDKTSFEESPINVLTKVDINKNLAVPSKISRLEKLKEFFSKNRSKNGKLVVPKKLSFMNDFVVSNFGSTQIYDYDDNKDVVGSRRDFASFSFYINAFTGELQSDISMVNCNESDFHMENRENILTPKRSVSPEARGSSPMDWTRPDTPEDLHEEPMEVSDDIPAPETALDTSDKDSLLNSSINIDEGIEIDEFERASMLLSTSKLSVPIFDIFRKSPNLFPRENESYEISNFTDKPIVQEPEPEVPPETQMKNIFMVPLKKLKHRCLFDLPNDEYGEMKKIKREQNKTTSSEPMRQTRIFNPFELMRQANITCHPEDPPFLGFTKAQQKEPMTYINYKAISKQINRDRSRSPHDSLRKYSNDSGLAGDVNSSKEISSQDVDLSVNQTELNSSEEQTSIELSSKIDSTIDSNSTLNTSQEANESPNTSADISDKSADATNETDNNVNISGNDSCYQSLVSGESSKADLSSFFKDIESRNATINESRESEDEDFNDSEEKVQQMKQSAINIAKWKEYLKPILANSEARSKIDMHQYGIEMLDKIGNVNDSKTFDEITEEGKTPAYFLTMLQLTNNRNIEFDFGERNMIEPVNIKNIRITVKSKILHQEKFDEMGQQFTVDEIKKVNKLKRKAAQTSTPAKRVSLNSSISFISANSSQNEDEDEVNFLSQASSGYCSQTSVFSDL